MAEEKRELGGARLYHFWPAGCRFGFALFARKRREMSDKRLSDDVLSKIGICHMRREKLTTYEEGKELVKENKR
jgi:hypothetical protein